MPAIRIATGRFNSASQADVERMLKDMEKAFDLREVLSKLPGLLHFYVGIDREHGTFTNVSVWDSLEHAHQLDTLHAMVAQRPAMVAAGAAFDPTTNHESIWTIMP